MTLPKWRVALFKKESEIQPGKIIQALWQLPVTEVIQPLAPSPSPADGNGASLDQAAAVPTEDSNYLGEGSRVTGKLNFQGPARIDGEFEGEITTTDNVTLGENAVVTAKIRAASIIVAGTVNGEMTASGSIEIRPSARVSGNLTQGQQGHSVDAQGGSPSDAAALGLESHRHTKTSSTRGNFAALLELGSGDIDS